MTVELHRSGMDTTLPPMTCARVKEHMPLLRSSVDHVARLAINMALLMELFEWQQVGTIDSLCRTQTWFRCFSHGMKTLAFSGKKLAPTDIRQLRGLFDAGSDFQPIAIGARGRGEGAARRSLAG